MARRRGNRESAVPALQDGSVLSERLFKEAGEGDFEFLVFEVLGDRLERLGLAVGRATHVYPSDSEGRDVDLRYLGTNNDYYRWFIDNEGRPGGLDRHAYHHLCRRHASRCSRNLGRDDVIHIQTWAPISKVTASDILEEWGQDRLGSDNQPPARPRAPVAALGATAKGKAKSTRREAVAALPAPAAEVEHFEEEDEEEVEGIPDKKPSLKRKRRTSERAKPEVTALDNMLDEGFGDEGGTSNSQMEKKLGLLRAKLQGRKEELRGKGPASVLAGKAVEAAESRKPKKSPKNEDVLKTISKALAGRAKSRGSREAESSEADSDGEEDGELDDLSKSGSWEARRKKLKKMSVDHPGRLLLNGLQSMREQLGVTARVMPCPQ